LADGTIITIQASGATAIATASAFASIDTNGVMSVSDVSSNAMATLNADGSIAMAMASAGAVAECSISSSGEVSSSVATS